MNATSIAVWSRPNRSICRRLSYRASTTTGIATLLGLTAAISVPGAFGQPFVTAVGNHGTIVRTNDGGQTWSPQSELFSYSGQNDLLAVDFVDPNFGWTSGQSQFTTNVRFIYLMLYTDNGGSSWRNADLGLFQYGFWGYGVDFIDRNSGWVVGSSGYGRHIWHTVDGGLNWSYQVSGFENTELRGVDFVDDQHGWAVGQHILHTSNGGLTWEIQESSAYQYLYYGVDFVDQNTGWAVGSSSQLIHTTDGGVTWTTQPHPNGHFLDVVFPTPIDGWIVGENGTILHTNNAGTTWALQSSGTTMSLHAVDFINSLEGWAAGQAGTILHTTDGGITWEMQDSGTDQTLNDIVAIVPEPQTAEMLLAVAVAVTSFLRRRPEP